MPSGGKLRAAYSYRRAMILYNGKAKNLNYRALLRAALANTRPIEQFETGDYNLRKN